MGRGMLDPMPLHMLWGEDPGLKPLGSVGLIQGAKAPCSLRNTKALLHHSEKVRGFFATSR